MVFIWAQNLSFIKKELGNEVWSKDELSHLNLCTYKEGIGSHYISGCVDH